MFRLVPQVLVLVAASALVPGAGALAQTGRPAQEIVSCIAANVPQGDELRSITLTTRDRVGVDRVDSRA